MITYKVAELFLNMKAEGNILKKQADQYISTEKTEANITINLNNDFLSEKQRQNPHLSFDECEYIWTGGEFYNRLLDYNGFMLHASAVALDNKAYLFSAKSGTGKSTHTGLWREYFGQDRAVIINDDKPAIRFLNKQFHVYGTPWSGKSDKNINMKVPLKCIIFIERGETNIINSIESKEAIKLILDQTIRPKQLEKVDILLGLIDELLKVIPVYKMNCNMSKDAVRLAYENCSGGIL